MTQQSGAKPHKAACFTYTQPNCHRPKPRAEGDQSETNERAPPPPKHRACGRRNPPLRDECSSKHRSRAPCKGKRCEARSVLHDARAQFRRGGGGEDRRANYPDDRRHSRAPQGSTIEVPTSRPVVQVDPSRGEWDDRLLDSLRNRAAKEQDRAVGDEVGVRTLPSTEERRDE